MITADATTLVAMSLLARNDIVRRLVGKVTVGDATAREIEATVQILDPECQPPGEEVVEVTYMDITAPMLSLSESETVQLAREHGVRLALSDDPVMRRELLAHGTRTIGTPGLLFAAYMHGMIQDPEESLRRLQQAGYRLSEPCRAALREAMQG